MSDPTRYVEDVYLPEEEILVHLPEEELLLESIARMEGEGGHPVEKEVSTPRTQTGETPRAASCTCSCPGSCPADCPPHCQCKAHTRSNPEFTVSGDEP